MTQYLTPEQVLFLHSRLIAETGGSRDIRDLEMLLLALGRPQAIFKKDLYPGLYFKTAALMDSLIRNHPFADGNKRAAIAASALFLRFNDYRLDVENSELVQFALACAQSKLSLNEIADWFKQNSTGPGLKTAIENN